MPDTKKGFALEAEAGLGLQESNKFLPLPDSNDERVPDRERKETGAKEAHKSF